MNHERLREFFPFEHCESPFFIRVYHSPNGSLMVEIYLLPEGVNGIRTHERASLEGVMVYGPLPNASERSTSCVWLYDGPWIRDFENMFNSLLREKDKKEAAAAETERTRAQKILDNYTNRWR